MCSHERRECLLITLKKNNTLSEQLIEIEKEISKGNVDVLKAREDSRMEISYIQTKPRVEHVEIEDLREELKLNLKPLKNELDNALAAIDNDLLLHEKVQKKIEELKIVTREKEITLEVEKSKIAKERKSAALKIGLGVSGFGVLFLLNSLMYFPVPILFFFLTYYLVFKFYDTPDFKAARLSLEENVKKLTLVESHITSLKQKQIAEYEKKSKSLTENTNKKILKLEREIQEYIQEEIYLVESKLRRLTSHWEEKCKQLSEYHNNLEKGDRGERIVTSTLDKGLGDNFYLLNDITIPSKNGKTTQIDHIVITRHGFIALETKHIEGVYYPHSRSKWCWFPPNKGYTGKKILCDNPQEQSIYHARQLNSFIPSVPVLPVVVLTNPVSEYKGADDSYCPVVNPKQLIRLVKDYSGNVRLSDDEINYFAQKLLEADESFSQKHSREFQIK